MKKYLIICSIFLFSAVLLSAQQEVTKFGVIDTSRVYTTYFRNSTGVRSYETKKNDFQVEVNKLTEELRKLQQTKIEYQEAKNDQAVLKIQAEITKKTDFLTEYTKAKNTELDSLKKKLETSDSFYSTLYSVIERIAEHEGYSLILSLQQANAILWYSPTVDITDKVISSLGSNY